MSAIIPFLSDQSAFDPQDIEAMSAALESVCSVLRVPASAGQARQVIAARIVELGRRGERDAARLRDRLLREATGIEEPAGDLMTTHSTRVSGL
jgi:hypothetical protein